jgi:hypothetical protein
MQQERTWVSYFDLGSGRDYIYHGTTTFRGLHYKDELGVDVFFEELKDKAQV